MANLASFFDLGPGHHRGIDRSGCRVCGKYGSTTNSSPASSAGAVVDAAADVDKDPKKKKKLLTCVGCRNKKYCSRSCQKHDWPSHKFFCKHYPKEFLESLQKKTANDSKDSRNDLEEKMTEDLHRLQRQRDPRSRLGMYAEGNTIFEPSVGIGIRWLTVKERRQWNCTFGTWKNGKTEEGWEDIRTPTDWAIIPYWKGEYASREEMIKYMEETYEDKEPREREIRRSDEEKVAYIHDFQLSMKEYCQNKHGANSPEEVVWDYSGIPRLVTFGKGADKQLKEAGWKYQGYKPGRNFELTNESVKVGNRLVCHNGFFWEERK